MPNTGFIKERKIECLLASAVFVVVFIMCCLTPLLVDDYTFSYSLVTGEPIGSISELVESLAMLRDNYNGRVVAHAFVQIMLMLPKMVFNILNSLQALALMYLALRFCKNECKSNITIMLLYVLLIWNFMPAFGETFIWLDGAFNYSWGLSFMCLFIWPFAAEYLGKGRKLGKIEVILFCLVAFIAGAYSENGSIAIIFMAFCFMALLLLEKKKVPFSLIIAFIISLLGFAFLMTAPAEANGRAAEISVSVIANNLKNIVIATKDRLFILYCAYAILFVLAWNRIDRQKLLASLVLVLGGLGSLASFSFAAYFLNRHFCFTVFFLVVAVLMLAKELQDKKTAPVYKAVVAILTVLFMFNSALAGIDILATYKDHSDRVAMINEAKANGVEGLVLPILQSGSEYCPASGSFDLSLENSETWPNPEFARYYGLEWVVGEIPES